MRPEYLFALCWGIVVTQRLAELFLAAKNRKALIERGGVEFGGDHYPYIVLLHLLWLVAWPAEFLLFRRQLSHLWPLWLSLLLAAQILRYTAIFTLGKFWNTRIIVLPGTPPIKRGIYRYIRHPNYWAVAIELACFPLLFDGYITAALFSAANAYLLLRIRIPAEEKALQLAAENSDPTS